MSTSFFNKEISENILSLLNKYYELSNKDYYVDRVTIIYALEYFNKISDFLYSGNPAISDDIAKIYLFDGRDDYFFTSTSVKTLSIYLYFINLYLYESTYQPVTEMTNNLIDFYTTAVKAVLEAPQAETPLNDIDDS